jgi:hypothetical protein
MLRALLVCYYSIKMHTVLGDFIYATIARTIDYGSKSKTQGHVYIYTSVIVHGLLLMLYTSPTLDHLRIPLQVPSTQKCNLCSIG